jgi:hypothetical protein
VTAHLAPSVASALAAGELACEARVPLLDFRPCGERGTAVYDYECAHGHVKRRVNCEFHEPEPGMAGCIDCRNAGHECPLTAREVTP